MSERAMQIAVKIQDIQKEYEQARHFSDRVSLRELFCKIATGDLRTMWMLNKIEIFKRETQEIIDMQNRYNVATLLFDLIPLRPLSGLVFQYTFALV